MKIGLVVDGESEYYSIGDLCEKVKPACGHTFLRAAKANVFGTPTAAQVVRSSTSAVRQQLARKADLVVVVLDFESRDGCPSPVAIAIAEGLRRETGGNVEVVFKHRMYENWLIADPQAMASQPARYKAVSKADIERFVPDRADAVDALGILKKYAKKTSYSKVEDSKRLVEHMDPVRAATNSRSLQKFLRTTGHPVYATQSKDAA